MSILTGVGGGTRARQRVRVRNASRDRVPVGLVPTRRSRGLLCAPLGRIALYVIVASFFLLKPTIVDTGRTAGSHVLWQKHKRQRSEEGCGRPPASRRILGCNSVGGGDVGSANEKGVVVTHVSGYRGQTPRPVAKTRQWDPSIDALLSLASQSRRRVTCASPLLSPQQCAGRVVQRCACRAAR